MSDKPSRLFFEDEISQILKRASEMQGEAGGRSYSGLTVNELQDLAAEADIDPRFIEAAAQELMAKQGASKIASIWGSSSKQTLRRRINGSVSDDAWERMVGTIEKQFKDPGETHQWDNSREWVLNDKKGTVASLVLHEHDGVTDLELFWHNRNLATPFIFLAAIPLIGWPLFLALILEGIGASGLSAFGIGVLFLMFFGLLARLGFGRSALSWTEDVNLLADRLASLGQGRPIEKNVPATENDLSAAIDVISLPEDDVKGEESLSDDRSKQRIRS